MDITEEDLKNMSPEQIAQLQKQNCIFCHIISGKVASKKVYEDDKVLGILDINPANPGHVLLLPKEHFMIMPQMSESILSHLFKVAKGISNSCLRAFKAQGTNIFVANGIAAGQKAQHFMIHVVPRKEGDALSAFNIPHNSYSSEQMEEIFSLLKERSDSILSMKPEISDLDKKREEGLKKIAEKDIVHEGSKAEEARFSGIDLEGSDGKNGSDSDKEDAKDDSGNNELDAISNLFSTTMGDDKTEELGTSDEGTPDNQEEPSENEQGESGSDDEGEDDDGDGFDEEGSDWNSGSDEIEKKPKEEPDLDEIADLFK